MDINSLLKENTAPATVSATPEQNGAVTLDINTILTQLKAVESDRAQLLQMVAEMKAKMEKLTQGKKQEMQKALDTVIDEWLKSSVDDENVRNEFHKGLSKLVEKTEEDHGVWRVAVAASNINKERLQQMENMRIELENIKKQHNIISNTNSFLQSSSGTFANENSRKRVHEEISSAPLSEPMGLWDDFMTEMRKRDLSNPREAINI